MLKARSLLALKPSKSWRYFSVGTVSSMPDTDSCRSRKFHLKMSTAHLLLGNLQDFLGAKLPESVTIVEVGPRDGLQNEKQTVLLLISLAAS